MRLVALLAVVGVAGCASTRPTLTPSEKLEHAVRRCNEQLAEVQRTAVPELQPYHTLRPDRVDWYVPSNDDPTGPIVLA